MKIIILFLFSVCSIVAQDFVSIDDKFKDVEVYDFGGYDTTFKIELVNGVYLYTNIEEEYVNREKDPLKFLLDFSLSLGLIPKEVILNYNPEKTWTEYILYDVNDKIILSVNVSDW